VSIKVYDVPSCSNKKLRRNKILTSPFMNFPGCLPVVSGAVSTFFIDISCWDSSVFLLLADDFVFPGLYKPLDADMGRIPIRLFLMKGA